MERLLVVVRTLAAAVAIVAVGAVGAAFGAGAAAQDTEPGVNLLLSARLCPDGPDAACEPAVGVAISVTSPDGGEVGFCTTEAITVQTEELGGCYVGAPRGAEVVVTEDPATLPAGYVPLENPRTITAGPPAGCVADCISGVGFVNVLRAQPTAPPSPTASAAPQPTTTVAPPQPTQAPGATTGGATTGSATTGATRALPNTGTGGTASDVGNGLPTAAVLLALVGAAAYGWRRRVAR